MADDTTTKAKAADGEGGEAGKNGYAPNAQTSADTRARVLEIIKSFDTAMLVTQDCDGLRARPLAIAEREDDGTLWFATARGSEKVAEIGDEPKVGITMQSAREQLSISGRAEIVDDRAKIDALWKESWKVWFPDGKDDPNIVLIRVAPIEAEYWDQRGLKGVRFLVEAAVAWVKGATPPQEEDMHGRVSLNGTATKAPTKVTPRGKPAAAKKAGGATKAAGGSAKAKSAAAAKATGAKAKATPRKKVA